MSVQRPTPRPPRACAQPALVDAIAAENERRRHRPAPRTRFDSVLGEIAEEVHRDYTEICGLIRGDVKEGGLTDTDHRGAAQAAEDVCNVAWHMTRLLPDLDPDGHPTVDEKGLLLQRGVSIDKHLRAHDEPTWYDLPNADARLPVALGMVTAERMAKERFKAHGFDAEARIDLAERLAHQGWSNSRRCDEMVLTTVAHVAASGEIEPIYAVLRVVRVKLLDGRPEFARHDRDLYRGGDYLSLETLLACRAPGDGLLLLRVMDEVWEWDPGVNVEDELDRIGSVAGTCLNRLEDALPEMPRIAVLDQILPLGMPSVQSKKSFFRQPLADIDRAQERRHPADLLLAADGPRAIHPEVLAQWTVVARHDELTTATRRMIDDLDDPAEPSRLVHFPDEPTTDDDLEPRFYVANVPRAAGDEYVQFGQFELTDRAYPKRSAGHRTMFNANIDRAKVEAAMQILLAYTAGEDIDAALSDPDALPRPLDGRWWTLFKPE